MHFKSALQSFAAYYIHTNHFQPRSCDEETAGKKVSSKTERDRSRRVNPWILFDHSVKSKSYRSGVYAISFDFINRLIATVNAMSVEFMCKVLKKLVYYLHKLQLNWAQMPNGYGGGGVG